MVTLLHVGRWRHLSAVLGALATIFTAHADVVPDGTMGPGAPLAGPDFVIPDTVGTTIGSNLFHSFGKFDLNEGQSATFTGPDNIRNVVGRVTGGRSSIDGRVASTIANANLYLLNPSGFVFGPNATLDVQGSFHATSADYIELSDGARFAALPSANDALLTSMAPAAFGFLGENPGPIAIDQSQFSVPKGETLSLVGGELTIAGTAVQDEIPTLRAPAGDIALVSVDSTGSVSVADGHVAATGFDRFANITLTDSRLQLDGGPGGGLYVQGGDILFDNSNVFSTNEGEAGGKALTITGANLAMRHGSQLTTAAEAAGKGGDIRVSLDGELSIKPDGLERRNGLITFNTGSGGGGDIFVDADRVLVDGEGLGFEFSTARISTFNGGSSTAIEQGILDGGSGKAGDMTVKAREIALLDSGRIQSGTFGTGRSGDITIEADRIIASGLSEQPNLPTGIRTRVGFGGMPESLRDAIEGDAGNVRIRAELVELDRGRIATDTNGRGRGGVLRVNAQRLVLANRGRISASSSASGSAGSIEVKAGHLLLTSRGEIRANGFDSGRGGSIDLEVGRLEVRGEVVINTETFGSGRGGNIRIEADSIFLMADEDARELNTLITSATFGEGDAGDIEIHTATLEVFEGATIASVTLGSGRGGDIKIFATGIVLDGGGTVIPSIDEIPMSGPVGFTSIASSSVTPNSGLSGNIEISTNTLTVAGGAAIDASTVGSRPGGTVNIEATSRVVVKGEGRISTESLGSGFGGTVTVRAQDLAIESGGTITASSRGAGAAGDVFVFAHDALTASGASVRTAAAESDGGNISLNAGRLVRFIDSEVSTSVQGGEGRGGNISIDPAFVLLDNSRISANAFSGPGGDVQIVAGNFIATPDSIVEASSELGINGNVNVDSPEADVSGGISVLPGAFLDATALLQTACAARAAGNASSLQASARGEAAVDPDGYLPSFTFDAQESPPVGRTREDASVRVSARPFLVDLECL